MRHQLFYFIIIFQLFFFQLEAQTTNVPDSNFEQALIDKGIDSDGSINGQVLTSDVDEIESLDLSNSHTGILKITGIEDFSALKVLNLSDSGIFYINEPLDLSMLTNLEELYVDSGGDSNTVSVYEIILTNNPNLKRFSASENWDLSLLNLTGSDMQINNLEILISKDLTFDETCVKVTNANDAMNQQGNYSNWTYLGSGFEFSENCSLNVNQISQNHIKLFPNPVSDKLTIQSKLDIKKITLFSIKGAKIQEFSDTELKNSMDLSKLQSGIYILEITEVDGKKLIKKILKK